jgi:F0F1-type ATP synthase membrane subunit c/vacuolar-type H+-ATPase subunit K
LFYAINHLILGILSVYITAYVVDALAPSFNSEKHLGRSIQLVAFGSTPALVARFFTVLPVIAGLIALVGAVYTIYVWYLGLGPVKRTPEDKKVIYLVVIFLALIVVYALIGLVIGLILRPVFGLAYGAGYGYYGL